jgi:topoisomerase-4 subunit B
LHGVGVAVTNALSTRMEVTILRGGKRHTITFAGGNILEKLRSEPQPNGETRTGTTVRVWPDAQFFENVAIPEHQLELVLRSKAYLKAGLEVSFSVEQKSGVWKDQVWHYENGLVDYFESLLEGRELVAPFFAGSRYLTEKDADGQTLRVHEGAAWAIAWVADGDTFSASHVNLISTRRGGTHESGFREGIFGAIQSFMDHHSLGQKGVKLIADDVWSRVCFILSAKLLEPTFEGQTKEKLNLRSAVKVVSTVVRDGFELWLNEHPADAKKIVELALSQALRRISKGERAERRKSSGVAILPGKLTDCASTDLSRNELFLVEGDSAGGSAKEARDKETQAILPLKGKVLNTMNRESDKVMANTEIQSIFTAIGIDPHGLADKEPKIDTLRYGKVIIMTDADVDGGHIQTLLLTLFYQHAWKLVSEGHVFVAVPPLYRISVAAQGKGRPERKIYAADERERDAALEQLHNEKVRDSSIEISRFKGLGEMNATQLRETAMHTNTRRLLRVTLNLEAKVETANTFRLLMDRSEAEARKKWMGARWHTIEADI